jgi:predicted DCC family thiol-disulfide oxidoreductase YuxK
MKPSNKIIIYDEDCPLCSAYTSAFVKTGILNEEGRRNFSNIDADIFNLVDKTKCNNEIPLIDTQTKQVWYGIDALLELLNTKIPFIKKLGNRPPVKWMLHRLYKFISYNRKVIVAIPSKNKYDSSPDFNMRYRLYFLICFLLFNSFMLLPLYNSIFSVSFIAGSSFPAVQYAHLAFVAVNISGAFFLGRKNAFEYLGQINMLALICILLLIPLLLVNRFTGLSNTDINNFYMGMVCMFIITDYRRRMRYAGIIQNYPALVALNVCCLIAFILYLIY